MKNLLILIALLTGTMLTAQSIDIGGGTTYAVVVGISDYQDEDIPDITPAGAKGKVGSANEKVFFG